jgi:Protein of unknown function (DUF2971)
MQIKSNDEHELSENEYLWKYLDLHRLLYFLTEESIYFNQLGKFSDPFEGFSNADLWHKLIADIYPEKENINRTLSENTQEEILAHKKNAIEKLKEIEKMQKNCFASCWFLCERESYAMWNLYSNKDSVALKFKANILKQKMLNKCELNWKSNFELVIHGKVSYAKIAPFDPSDKAYLEINHKYKGFLKDISFSHEKEFRFMTVAKDFDGADTECFELPIGPLSDLEFEVICHPYMDEWKVSNLRNVLKRFNLETRIKKSGLSTKNNFII